MKLIKKAVGKKILQARKLAGFKTQADFAIALNTDTSTVGRWESGVHKPSAEFWQKIYALTNTNENYFSELGIQDESESISTIKNALKEVIAENSHVLTDREKRILAVGDVIPVEVLEAMAKDWKILKRSIPRIVGVSIKELEKAEQDLSQIKTKKRA